MGGGGRLRSVAQIDKRWSVGENARRAMDTGQWRFRSRGCGPPGPDAVLMAVRDVSASVDEAKKEVVRGFFRGMLRILQTRYENVSVVYIVHWVRAEEVPPQEFFARGESGGSKVSPAYVLSRRIMADRFAAGPGNLYFLHFSDGDNWSDEDNSLSINAVEELLPWVQIFGYVEVRDPAAGPSTLMSAFSAICDASFHPVKLSGSQDIEIALRQLFPATQ